MGPEWTFRSKMAYGFILAVIAIFIGFRLWNCDSIGEVILAVVLAMVTGTIFFSVNKAIFGAEAMNFLGLPYMVSKESEGSPIYVCAADKQDDS